MVNPSAMESRYRDRPESNSRQNFARFTGTRVTRVNSRVPEKNAPSVIKMFTTLARVIVYWTRHTNDNSEYSFTGRTIFFLTKLEQELARVAYLIS